MRREDLMAVVEVGLTSGAVGTAVHPSIREVPEEAVAVEEVVTEVLQRLMDTEEEVEEEVPHSHLEEPQAMVRAMVAEEEDTASQTALAAPTVIRDTIIDIAPSSILLR